MAEFFFFTEPSKLGPQSPSQAFGPQTGTTTHDKYLTQNLINLTADAKAFAVVKGQILIEENNANPNNLVNVVLKPSNKKYIAGLPIKYFIYRGINKLSILNGNLVKQPADINEKTILGVVKRKQEVVNVAENNTLNISKNVLGFDSITSSTDYIDKYYIDTDTFQPLMVDMGCELGIFNSTLNNAGIQIVLDNLYEELTIQDLVDDTLTLKQFPKYTPDTSQPNKTQLINRFTNRTSREKVLSYIDIIAFYGSALSQGHTITSSDSTNYDLIMNHFVNKNAIYIDIRDNWGLSYNHYLKSSDTIKYSVSNYNTDQELVFTDINYYTDWPILKLNALNHTSSDLIQIKLPILGGRPLSTNILSSFTLNCSTKLKRLKERNVLLNYDPYSSTIDFGDSETISLKNTKDSSNNFRSNILLLKITKYSVEDKAPNKPRFNNLFPISLANKVDDYIVEDGSFVVKKISSLYSPVHYNKVKQFFYTNELAVVKDKDCVTFLSIKEEEFFNLNQNRQRSKFQLYDFKYSKSLDSIPDYDASSTSMGFLYQAFNHSSALFNNLPLVHSECEYTNDDNSVTNLSYLNMQIQGIEPLNDHIQQNVISISLDNSELDALKVLNSSTIANTDYFSNHVKYMASIEDKSFRFDNKVVSTHKIHLNIPKVSGEVDSEQILLEDHPNTLTVGSSNEGIILTTVNQLN